MFALVYMEYYQEDFQSEELIDSPDNLPDEDEAKLSHKKTPPTIAVFYLSLFLFPFSPPMETKLLSRTQ